ncbi:MAG TPA: amidohydrolase family protein, partial [Rectinemataceae bacterium]
MREKADLLLTAKRIYSVDMGFGIYEAMAVRGGRVLALGRARDLEDAYSYESRLDYPEYFVYPGFYDPHCHFLSYGWVLGRAQLFGTRSWEEAVGRMVAHAASHPPSSGEDQEAWVQGRGWDQNLWGGGFPDRRLLDAAFPRTPAIAIRVDGHAAVANAEALKRAGIRSDTRIEGGSIRLEDGEPTGFLVDKAVDAVRHSIPRPSRAQIRSALLAAQEKCFACGLTSVSNAGTEADEAEAMIGLSESGELAIGLYIMLVASEENLRIWKGRGPLSRGRLSVRSFKAFADGALGSRGAYLLEPYEDDPASKGLF